MGEWVHRLLLLRALRDDIPPGLVRGCSTRGIVEYPVPVRSPASKGVMQTSAPGRPPASVSLALTSCPAGGCSSGPSYWS